MNPSVWRCSYVAESFRGVPLERITNGSKIEAAISSQTHSMITKYGWTTCRRFTKQSTRGIAMHGRWTTIREHSIVARSPHAYPRDPPTIPKPRWAMIGMMVVIGFCGHNMADGSCTRLATTCSSEQSVWCRRLLQLPGGAFASSTR